MPSTNGLGAAERRPHDAPPPRPPTITDALIRVFDAGQRVLLDRVELARLDVVRLAERSLRAATLVAVGAVCLAGAWFALLAAAVVALLGVMSLPAALALAAVASVAVGGALIYAGVQRARAMDRVPGVIRAADAPSDSNGRS